MVEALEAPLIEPVEALSATKISTKNDDVRRRKAVLFSELLSAWDRIHDVSSLDPSRCTLSVVFQVR